MCGMILRKFTCALCGETYIAAWNEEEANAESLVNFGFIPAPEDRVTVCTPCHVFLMANGFAEYCRDHAPMRTEEV